MLKDMAWNVFKKTGDINSYLELKDIEEISVKAELREDKNISNIGGLFGNSKDKRDSN